LAAVAARIGQNLPIVVKGLAFDQIGDENSNKRHD
jgi:hypothetical protein